MDCSMPGLPVHHQPPQFTQIHVHWVSEAIQPSHPLSSPSPAFNLSSIRVFSNESSFQMSFSHQVTKVLEFQLQNQSFQWLFRTDFLRIDWLDLLSSPRDSQESSPTPQFKNISSSVFSFFMVQLSYPYRTTGKTIALTRQTFVGKVMSQSS